MALNNKDFQDLVENFVRGSIRRPQDTLGVRRTDISFSDVQESAAAVFLLNSKAAFYVLFLACQRLAELIDAEETIVNDIQRLVFATGRGVYPIKDLSPLNNITAALQELERAIGERTSAFKNIEDVPAFKRFDENIQRFIESAGRNVKEAGELIETPQEARAKLPLLLRQLKESHAEIVRKVVLIRDGMTDYGAVNLPSIAAAGVISRSRQVLSERADSLAVSNETERLNQNKDTVLELLASRAVVRQYGSLRIPSTVFEGNFVADPFSDGEHPGSPPTTIAQNIGYTLVDGRNVLDFWVDRDVVVKYEDTVTSVAGEGIYGAVFSQGGGGFTGAGVSIGDIVYAVTGLNFRTRWVVTSFTDTELHCNGVVEALPDTAVFIRVMPAADESVQLLNCQQVKMDGLAAEPLVFYRDAGAGASPDNYRLSVNGTMYETHNFSGVRTVSWSSYPMGEFIEDLNAQLPVGEGYQFEPYFTPAGFDGEVSLSFVSGTTYRATVIFSDLDSVGIQATGWYLRVMTGPDKDKLWRITAVGVSPTLYVNFDVPSGAPTLQNVRVQIGRRPKVRINYPNQFAAVSNELSIYLGTDYSGSGAFTFGMTDGRQVTGKGLRPQIVTDDISSKSTKVRGGIHELEVGGGTSLGRSNPLQPTVITAYKVRGLGDVQAVGPDITVTTDVDLTPEFAFVILRDASVVNAVFSVTSLFPGGFTATGADPVNTQDGVTFEGADLDVPYNDPDVTVHIDGPVANSGTYAVLSWNSVADMVVTPLLPQRQDLEKQPVFFGLSLTKDFLTVQSRSTGLEASVVVNGSAGVEIFSSVPTARNRGTTTWLKFNALPSALQVGDSFEYHETDYKTPTFERKIVSIDLTNKLVELDGPVAANVSYNVSSSSPVPFALLRVAQAVSTEELETRLDGWLARQENKNSYFTDLNRYLNPVLINQNPTVVQVADAEARIIDLYKYLNAAGTEGTSVDVSETLDVILSDYVVEVAPAVETLLHTYREKGADRALDLLLEANFSGFFGVDVDESSYAGDMLKKLRGLAREDLPVRKTERLETQQGRMLAQTDDEDFEYSGSDTQSGGVPKG